MILSEIQKFVNEITSTTSRNKKIEILEKYTTSSIINKFLYFIFNPYITTGISKMKINKVVKDNVDNKFKNLFDILDYIKEHNTGTDEVLSKVQSFIKNNTEFTDLLRKIFIKDLQLGIDAKTINKALKKDFIPTFSVQLANSYQKRKDKILGKEINITTKIDGVRCFVIKHEDDIHFYNRSGIEITGLNDLYLVLSKLKGLSFCLDSELYAIGDFKESKDGYKATIERSRVKGLKQGLKLRVFDFIPIDNYIHQKCDVPYKQRQIALKSTIDKINNPFIEMLPSLYRGIANENIIDEIAHKQIEKGEEGIMINDINSVYTFKRSDALLKYKLFEDYDLEVIGFEEGDGRNKGILGALLVKYKDFIVKVGSGFSDELRKEIWNNREDWLGRTVIIKAFESTSNQQGGESLRFPVYVDWRDDK